MMKQRWLLLFTVFLMLTALVGNLGIATAMAAATTPFTTTLKVAGGINHTVAVKEDGTVWAWGDNSAGQLGDGSVTSSETPVQAYGLTRIIEVAAGNNYSLALRDDGTVWSWGTNESGQLGHAYNIKKVNYPYPHKIEGLTDIKAISAGYNHNLVLKNDGSIWAWGANNGNSFNSKVGNGGQNPTFTPVKVSTTAVTGTTVFESVSAGYGHSLALDSSGALWAWGDNYYGQFGNDNNTSKTVPTKTNLTGIKAISAGFGYSLILKTQGTVWSSGSNANGQLGYGTTTTINSTLKQVPDLTDVTGISAGVAEGPHSLVFKQDSTGGMVWAFGTNTSGELGDGTTVSSSTPLQVTGLTNVTAAKVGGASSLVVTGDGKILGWGQNTAGELGIGSKVNQPSPVAALSFESGATLTAVANGPTSMNLTWSYPGAVGNYVLKRGNTKIYESTSNTSFTDNGVLPGVPGSGLTAGASYDYTLEVYNDSKLVATKTVTESTTDVVSTRGAAPVKMALGVGHTVWLKEDGTVWSWGDNTNGQLGDGGKVASSTTPVQAYGLTKVTDIAAGYNYTLALKDDGTLWSWGGNEVGQLGHSRTNKAVYPHKIEVLGNEVKAISAGYNHNLILKKDGSVWAWGGENPQNFTSKIGNGGDLSQLTPVKVSPADVIFDSVSAGYSHSLALDSSGTLWGWGDSASGELGLSGGASSNKNTPTKTTHTEFTAISAGYGYTLALKPDGTVWGFGANGDGQIGNWYSPSQATPTRVAGLENVAEISASKTGNHSLVVKHDGTAWAFGGNANGQLGDGTTMSRHQPVRVGSVVTNVASVLAGKNYSVAIRDNGTVLMWGQYGTGLKITAGDYQNAVPVSNLDLSLGIGRGLTLTGVADGPTAMDLSWGYAGSQPISKYVLKRGDQEIYSDPSGATTSFRDDGKSVYTFGLTMDTEYLYTIEAYGSDGKLLATKTVPASTEKLAYQTPNTAANLRVSASETHALMLKADGTVWAWGTNTKGQLGNGTTTASTVPVQVPGLTDVKDVAAGYAYSLVLKNDNTVWVWGTNNSGQLGNGTSGSSSMRLVPGQVMTDVKAISAGYDHNLVIKNDGSIWAWGGNNTQSTNSKIGNGGTLAVTTPVKVSPTDAVFNSVSAGRGHSLALDTSGTLWGWGDNVSGQFGDGTGTSKTVPTITNLTGMKAISAGSGYSLMLKQDGTVWSAGVNGSGQLGNWYSPNQSTLKQVVGLDNVAEVSAGKFGTIHSLVVKQDGTVFSFGGNANGQLGDGTTIFRHDPVRVGSIATNVVTASPGNNYSVALKDDGTLLTWGSGTLAGIPERHNVEAGLYVSPVHLTATATNSTTVNLSYYVEGNVSAVTWKIKRDATNLSQCLTSGNNLTCDDKGLLPETTYLYRVDAYNQDGAWLGSATVQVKTPATEGVVAVMAGANHSLAVKGDGSVWAWGRNSSGELGINNTSPQKTATQVIFPADVKISSVTAKQFHSLALDQTGHIWAWGHNVYGQLGNGSLDGFTDANNDGKPDNVLKPVQLKTIDKVTMISAGGTHTLALKEDGTVWAWGDNQYGQLGGRMESRVVYPVQVTGLTNIKSVIAGIRSSYAIGNDGSVWVWGDNRAGQLGSVCMTGTTCVVQAPVKLNEFGTSKIKEVITGFDHVLALDTDGSLWSWGYNSLGQLGQRSEPVYAKPAKITDPTFNNAVGISKGGYHFSSLALRSAGQLWGVGDNQYGQLGNNSMNNVAKLGVLMLVNDDPTTSEVERVVAYSGGAAHSVVLLSNGKVMATGDNRYGALGSGTYDSSTILVPVVFPAN